MGAWNLKEFKTLCLNSGLDKAWFYAESLAFKWNAAVYHKSKIQQKIDEIDLKSFLEKALDYSVEIAFELDALMVTLNSMWDILGQLTNECFIRPKIPESGLYFDNILNNKISIIQQNSIPSTIKSTLEDIKKNELYGLIKAYANVSKHRYAIQGDCHIDFTKIPTTVSYVTEFEYNGEWHKLTIDDAFKCWKFVGESLIQVGTKTQELVKLGNIT